jgi:hypothetical protein
MTARLFENQNPCQISAFDTRSPTKIFKADNLNTYIQLNVVNPTLAWREHMTNKLPLR